MPTTCILCSLKIASTCSDRAECAAPNRPGAIRPQHRGHGGAPGRARARLHSKGCALHVGHRGAVAPRGAGSPCCRRQAPRWRRLRRGLNHTGVQQTGSHGQSALRAMARAAGGRSPCARGCGGLRRVHSRANSAQSAQNASCSAGSGGTKQRAQQLSGVPHLAQNGHGRQRNACATSAQAFPVVQTLHFCM